MASNVSLSISARSNLLSLQNTKSLIDRTTARLSTGLKVASPIDGAAAYFSAKALSDRASDFNNVKDSIDQAISSINAALDGLKSITSLVENLKATLVSAANATTLTDSQALVAQYNGLLTQIDKQAGDASYQGKNLINNGSQSLKVQFNEDFTVTGLAVAAQDNSSTGLNLFSLSSSQLFTFNTTIPSADSRPSQAAISSLQSVPSFAAVNQSPSQASADTLASQASQTSQNSQNSTIDASGNTTPSQSSRASVATVASIPSHASFDSVQSAPSISSVQSVAALVSQGSVGSIAAVSGVAVQGVNTTLIDNLTAKTQAALSRLRTSQSTLGSNVTVLQIRLEFTKNYVNDLTAGSDKLTLADTNEEGANLTSLQTKQQLGITALSITTQSEQSILKLF